MLVKELIEKLKTFKQDANVVVLGNGKGGSPYIDIDEEGVHEDEDCEPDESSSHSIVHTRPGHKPEDGEDYRNVVVLFESDDLY